MNNINFNQLRDRAYKCACDHGFHELELSNEHFLCLVISELMEAVQADRSSMRADIESFNARNNRGEKSKYHLSEEAQIRNDKINFELNIEGTVECELADAVIRLFDLAGLRGVEIDFFPEEVDDNAEDFKDKSFTECIYHICRLITIHPRCGNSFTTINFGLNYLIVSLLGLAKHLDIDLPFFIEQKMKYNELRENKHGKKY